MEDFDNLDETRRCDVCGRTLDMVPDQAGERVAVRLDCAEHGPQLMWVPFGDDAATPEG